MDMIKGSILNFIFSFSNHRSNALLMAKAIYNIANGACSTLNFGKIADSIACGRSLFAGEGGGVESSSLPSC